MKTPTFLLLLALLTPSAALCAPAGPPPEPEPERGAIAVDLVALAPVGTRIAADRVVFVRLEPGESVLDASEVLPSNHADGDRVYLLNCEPGRYVAVAATLGFARGGPYELFLDQEAIEATEIEVEAGRTSFMGSLLVNLGWKINRADPAQAHYLRLLQPRIERLGYMNKGVGDPVLYLAKLVTLDRGPGAEGEPGPKSMDAGAESE